MAFSQRIARFAPLAPLLACLSVAVACSHAAGPIQIGVAGAFDEPDGRQIQHAAELAVEEINGSGGIDHRPVALVLRNDYDDPDSAAFVAEDLYQSDVVAVVGHRSHAASLAADAVYAIGERPVALLSLAPTSGAIADAGGSAFGVRPGESAHGAVLARWAYERLALRRGAVLYLNDEYGRGLRQTLVDEFARLGGELTSIDPYLGDTPQVGPFLDRMATRDHPDFLFVAGNRRDSEYVIREARRHGLTVPILGGEGLYGVERAGPAADGVYYSSAYFPAAATAANRRFLAAYRRRHPGETPDHLAAATYDAIFLLRDAIVRGSPDRGAVRTTLAATGSANPFEGVTGSIAFDAASEASRRRVHVGLVQNGAVAPQERR